MYYLYKYTGEVAKQGKNLELNSALPHLAGKQKHRQNYPISELKYYYFQAVFAPLLDFVFSRFDDRLAGHRQNWYKFVRIGPSSTLEKLHLKIQNQLFSFTKVLIGDILDSDYGTEFEL